jgi:hypothetical protein
MENVKNDFYKKGQFPKPAIYREQLLTVDGFESF